MHPLHVPILLVLLLIPNSTWRDWQAADAPHLHQICASSAVGVMNARTAERDKITTEGGLRTILAGARMTTRGGGARLDYPVKLNNLQAALLAAGISVQVNGNLSGKSGTRGKFIAQTLGSNPARDDAAIGAWQRRVAKAGGVLLIASPNPSVREYAAEDRLTPLVIWQPGGRSGLLTSPSTRRPGLIANTDLAPTIAAFAGATLPGASYGEAAVIASSPKPGNPIAFCQAISARGASQAREQRIVPYMAVYIAILVALGSLWRAKYPRASRVCIVAAALTALCLSILTSTALCIIVPLLLAVCVGMNPRLQASRLFILSAGAIYIVFVTADALCNGAELTAQSLLGYSVMEGARYYGLGNESMGLLIGAAAALCAAWSVKRFGVAAGIALLLALAAVLGAPEIGAKAGGLLVALITLAAYLASVLNQPKRSLLALGLFILGALALGFIALFALGHLGKSHVSQTVAQAHTHGFGVILSVIHRKLAMDFHLMLHSAWVLVLLTAIVATARLRAALAFHKNRMARILLTTGGVATAACLALNDAGVVAAALCALLPMAYLSVLSEQTMPRKAASSKRP